MTQPFTLAACAEMLWPAVARALNDMGYRGPVGMEAYAAGDPEAALEAYRRAFTI